MGAGSPVSNTTQDSTCNPNPHRHVPRTSAVQTPQKGQVLRAPWLRQRFFRASPSLESRASQDTHTPSTNNMSARLPIDHRPLGGRALRHQLVQRRAAMAIDSYLSPSPWQPVPGRARRAALEREGWSPAVEHRGEAGGSAAAEAAGRIAGRALAQPGTPS